MYQTRKIELQGQTGDISRSEPIIQDDGPTCLRILCTSHLCTNQIDADCISIRPPLAPSSGLPMGSISQWLRELLFTEHLIGSKSQLTGDENTNEGGGKGTEWRRGVNEYMMKK